MKNKKWLLIISMSALTLGQGTYAQESTETEGAVSKQQLEDFLAPKDEAPEAHETVIQGQAESGQASSQAPADETAHETVPAVTEVKTETNPEAPQQTEAEVPVEAPSGEQAPAAPVAHEEAHGETPKEAVAPEEHAATPEVKSTESTVAPTAPAAVEHVEEKAPAAEVAEVQTPPEEESLLDTIDIEEGGNWLLKRKALQDTVGKIEDINALYDDIRDTNVIFLQGINTIDVLFTQFAYEVGLDLGRIDQLVQDVALHLDEERQTEGVLSEAEREILQKAQERKKEIEELRSNIQDVWQMQAQLKEARSLDEEQIIESDRLRKQAWGNFRKIEKVLSEEKAEELYHETVQLFATMQASYRYLQTRLIPHFQQSIKILQEKIESVKKQAEQLQSQGVLLKHEAIAVDRKEKEIPAQPEFVEQVPEKARGWLDSIKSALWAPFGAIGRLWNWITGSSEDMNKYMPESATESLSVQETTTLKPGETPESKATETHHPEEL